MKEFLTAIILMALLLFGGLFGYQTWDHARTIKVVERQVLNELVAPATAKFSNATVQKVRDGRLTYLMVTGCVDSENRSGGLVRSDFSAKVFDEGKVESLKIVSR